MFRKNAEEALGEWSEENVILCANRQRGILDEAVKMLKTGGKMLYSTCTFSTEEDEGQILDFLSRHQEMRLIKQEKLYPHKTKGEGHFVALLQKTDEGTTCNVKPLKTRVNTSNAKIYAQFEKDFFNGCFARNLHEVDGVLYDVPENIFDWQGLQVLRVGVRLGEVKNGRFEPNHSLAMAVKKSECKNAVELTGENVEKYLRGETVNCDNVSSWCLVCIDGYPLGIGKASGGIVKNHLPKGLRLHI